MKRKALALLLTVATAATMLVGCGDKAADSNESSTPAVESDSESEATPDSSVEAPAEEGKVLNIYCWNEEFKTRVTDHYPGYEPIDGTHGKIGDVDVVWNITPSDDNAYQNNLDATLLGQADAAADDKIDLFLLEADYALKYVDTDYTMNIKDLGITDADIADQYKYTQDIVTDSNGAIKGISWQGCPGALFYNRQAAIDILGSDDAATVQAAVKDWDTFVATAADAKAAGYKMCSSVNDTYRVYSNNVSSKWVVDGKINIDDNIMKWVEDSKVLVDNGYTNTYDLWSDDWKKGFYPEGKVFCYFGPAWFINFSMGAERDDAGNVIDNGSIAGIGGWGITEGPQGFFWGGTWMAAAAGTDNPSLVKDLMLKLTCDKDIMVDIVKADDDFVNNKPAMEEMANDASYSSFILGGINPLSYYVAGADSIDLSNLSAYDQGCNEEFQNAMKDYFNGKTDLDTALETFKKNVVVKYPELTY